MSHGWSYPTDIPGRFKLIFKKHMLEDHLFITIKDAFDAMQITSAHCNWTWCKGPNDLETLYENIQTQIKTQALQTPRSEKETQGMR